MYAPTQLVRRFPISAFAVLACLFGWMIYGLAAVGVPTDTDNMPLGPLMAALVVTSCQGREALRAYGRTLRGWAASPWLYAVAVGAPIAMHLSIVLANHLLGAPLPTAVQLGAWPEVPLAFVSFLVLVGIGEEAGWTAFAAPVLLRRFGLLGAFGILAALRILWHLPLVLTGEMPLGVAVVGNAAFQLIVLQMLRHRRGSWALAAVWHATLNAFGAGFFFTMVSGPDQDRLFLLLALVYALGAAVALVLPRIAAVRRGSRTPDPALEPSDDQRDRFLVG